MPVILMLIAAGLAAQPITPANQPKPAAEPLPALATDMLPSVDTVLTRLETSDKDLKTLSAAISLIKKLPAIEGGGSEVRYGTLNFSSGLDAAQRPLRKFAINLDTMLIEGKVRDDKKQFIFDGHYLLETWPTQKQYVRRHIVGADQKKDPLRIGEGPFPIPVGQRKADLLARFNISVVPALESAPESEQLRRILFTCIQLKLIPKEGTEQAKAFSEIRLWYASADMLPIFAGTANTDGSSNEVFLTSIKKNAPIPDSTFDTTAPKKTDGWNGEEQDLRDKVEIAPGAPTKGPGPAAPITPPVTPSPVAPKPSEPTPVQPK